MADDVSDRGEHRGLGVESLAEGMAMWRQASTRLVTASVGMVLLAAGGCTISVQPWTKASMAPAGPDAGASGVVPSNFQVPVPRPLPGSGPGPGAPNNETMVQLIKQYNEADDHRKALQDQVQTLKKQVKDREDNLRLASHEIEESSSKLKRTRDEFRQWEAEMTELRERVRKLEDNRKAVGQLIDEILKSVERPREPVRLPMIELPQK